MFEVTYRLNANKRYHKKTPHWGLFCLIQLGLSIVSAVIIEYAIDIISIKNARKRAHQQ